MVNIKRMYNEYKLQKQMPIKIEKVKDMNVSLVK